MENIWLILICATMLVVTIILAIFIVIFVCKNADKIPGKKDIIAALWQNFCIIISISMILVSASFKIISDSTASSLLTILVTANAVRIFANNENK